MVCRVRIRKTFGNGFFRIVNACRDAFIVGIQIIFALMIGKVVLYVPKDRLQCFKRRPVFGGQSVLKRFLCRPVGVCGIFQNVRVKQLSVSAEMKFVFLFLCRSVCCFLNLT